MARFKRSPWKILFLLNAGPMDSDSVLHLKRMDAVLYVGCAAKCEKGLKNNNSPFAAQKYLRTELQ
jgi:hypothetical protein